MYTSVSRGRSCSGTCTCGPKVWMCPPGRWGRRSRRGGRAPATASGWSASSRRASFFPPGRAHSRLGTVPFRCAQSRVCLESTVISSWGRTNSSVGPPPAHKFAHDSLEQHLRRNKAAWIHLLPLKTLALQGSSAEVAGLRQGDELVAVDGTPVTSATPYQVNTACERLFGRQVCLALQRDGAPSSRSLAKDLLWRRTAGCAAIWSLHTQQFFAWLEGNTRVTTVSEGYWH